MVMNSDPPAEGALDNRAMRMVVAMAEAFARHDWAWFRSVYAEDVRGEDHRATINSGIIHGIEPFIELTIGMADAGFVAMVVTPLATRGDNLAVMRRQWQHPSDIEFMNVGLIQLDDDGLIIANFSWDVDDVDRAVAEMDRRYHHAAR